ncbi:MAG: cupredoxin domain-containing protein [Alphaproteobacteria bacterium]|nr:cupredoxin domain-containing protein [Alphaproteobacteria bacterium]
MTSEGDLGEAKLEEIHKDSYALEAATDFLRSEGSTDAALVDSLDEAVQALHYASENVEAEQTKEWFGKLGPILEQVYASKQASAPLEKKDFYEIAIKDHAFSPAEIRVPAGEKVKLKVHNQDATPEEFESHDLNREKVIAGGQIATIFVGPLEPGKYHYFGEFNMDSAQGYIIAE